jgi:Protein of unknown function (DUF3108)
VGAGPGHGPAPRQSRALNLAGKHSPARGGDRGLLVYTHYVMRFPAGALALFLTASWLLPAQTASSGASAELPATERLSYDVEWRLIHAGDVTIESDQTHATMKIQSAGLVSSLYKVNDSYSVDFDRHFCASSSFLTAQEGKRHRETKVTFDSAQNRATYLERDLIKDAVIHAGQVDIPGCVHEVISAIFQLRTHALEPGQSVQLPMSDGRRAARVKLEAQAREDVKTTAGMFKTVRYEAYLLNGVIYTRKGRVQVWLSDDERHLPVQIRLRLQFPIGTITLQLEKEERT